MPQAETDIVATIRAFNRFYTRRIGLLDEHLSESPFSLTEARVLYEIAHRDAPTAAEIARDLVLDPAYLSRILKRFRTAGLVEARVSEHHAKHRLLALSAAGQAAFATLDSRMETGVAGLIERLDSAQQRRLAAAAQAMRELLVDVGPGAAANFVLRPPAPGELGLVVARQAVLYAVEYGWNRMVEGLSAEIVGRFVRAHDAARDRCWIADWRGIVAGSVFLMHGEDEATGKLRLLYVERMARGLGIGRALVTACVDEARRVGYRRLTLWTNHVLVDARRLYEAAGFRLVSSVPHTTFGPELIGQTWTLDL